MTDGPTRGRWMPQRPTAFVVGGVVIIIVLLGVSALAQLQATDAVNLSARSLATSDTAERLLGAVRDAETGQRGYLLTGSDDYLSPYNAATANVAPTYARLASLVADKPEEAQRVADLKAPLDDKMAELTETVRLAQNGDHAGALKLVLGGSGKSYMDDLRGRIEEVQAAELVTRQALSSLETERRNVNLAAFVVAIVGLVVLGWWLLRVGHIRSLELQESNATLEARVAERTAALQKEQSRVELLLHDMNHRVGNNLSVIAAILGLQRRQTADPEVRGALAAAEERIAAIGATQRRMRLNLDSDDVDGRQFFLDLAEDLRQTCAGRPITIATEIDDVRLPGREAVTYGVLVNELMTNSIKHAFPGDSGGTVTLLVRTPGPGEIMVQVVDDGVGMPAGEGKGLGTTILTNLAKSLGAQVRTEPANPGAPRPGSKTSFTATPTVIVATA